MERGDWTMGTSVAGPRFRRRRRKEICAAAECIRNRPKYPGSSRAQMRGDRTALPVRRETSAGLVEFGLAKCVLPRAAPGGETGDGRRLALDGNGMDDRWRGSDKYNWGRFTPVPRSDRSSPRTTRVQIPPNR